MTTIVIPVASVFLTVPFYRPGAPAGAPWGTVENPAATGMRMGVMLSSGPG
jgi:hypothetical protein